MYSAYSKMQITWCFWPRMSCSIAADAGMAYISVRAVVSCFPCAQLYGHNCSQAISEQLPSFTDFLISILLLVKMKEKKLLKMQSLPKVLRSQAMRSYTSHCVFMSSFWFMFLTHSLNTYANTCTRRASPRKGRSYGFGAAGQTREAQSVQQTPPRIRGGRCVCVCVCVCELCMFVEFCSFLSRAWYCTDVFHTSFSYFELLVSCRCFSLYLCLTLTASGTCPGPIFGCIQIMGAYVCVHVFVYLCTCTQVSTSII